MNQPACDDSHPHRSRRNARQHCTASTSHHENTIFEFRHCDHPDRSCHLLVCASSLQPLSLRRSLVRSSGGTFVRARLQRSRRRPPTRESERASEQPAAAIVPVDATHLRRDLPCPSPQLHAPARSLRLAFSVPPLLCLLLAGGASAGLISSHLSSGHRESPQAGQPSAGGRSRQRHQMTHTDQRQTAAHLHLPSRGAMQSTTLQQQPAHQHSSRARCQRSAAAAFSHVHPVATTSAHHPAAASASSAPPDGRSTAIERLQNRRPSEAAFPSHRELTDEQEEEICHSVEEEERDVLSTASRTELCLDAYRHMMTAQQQFELSKVTQALQQAQETLRDVYEKGLNFEAAGKQVCCQSSEAESAPSR
jgi:hypothetical protein